MNKAQRRQSWGVWFSPLFVCVSVYPHDISETDTATITKLDMAMFHVEFV